MNTAVINIKTNPIIKKKAQSLAEEMGLSLSAVINRLLKLFIETKTVVFTAREEPTDYLLQALKESKEDIKAGRVISFDKPEKALDFLDKMIANESKSKRKQD
ncbi:type II toxin-antitoxin system RelB/DinJ family antitoxin [Candidatus Roizmanbacteria bacterium]|nr:type II toxin-antitoxin system RelB/DinJ family antitoxin [Candidatus Roizmanbacteria bacterium]